VVYEPDDLEVFLGDNPCNVVLGSDETKAEVNIGPTEETDDLQLEVEFTQTWIRIVAGALPDLTVGSVPTVDGSEFRVRSIRKSEPDGAFELVTLVEET